MEDGGFRGGASAPPSRPGASPGDSPSAEAPLPSNLPSPSARAARSSRFPLLRRRAFLFAPPSNPHYLALAVGPRVPPLAPRPPLRRLPQDLCRWLGLTLGWRRSGKERCLASVPAVAASSFPPDRLLLLLGAAGGRGQHEGVKERCPPVPPPFPGNGGSISANQKENWSGGTRPMGRGKKPLPRV